jgi:hypothetical protein
MSDIINAVARLERAGSENSRVTNKLHAAASTVADWIEGQVPVNVLLPRGYRVKRVKSNVGYTDFLVRESKETNEYGEPVLLWIDGTGVYLHGDFHAAIPSQTRHGSLLFANDVASGLLDEIAAWMEKLAAECDSAAKVLENA